MNRRTGTGERIFGWTMARAFLPLLAFALAACGSGDGRSAGEAAASSDDDRFQVFAPGSTAEDLQPAIDRGILSRGKAAQEGERFDVGLDSIWFVVVRDGERHGTSYRHAGYHCVVGAGVTLPAGELLVRRDWGTAGEIDGDNAEPQKFGIALVVEPGAPAPYAAEVVAAARTFVAALVRRKPIHPDCVLAMEEVPFTHAHSRAPLERTLAEACRMDLDPPPAPGRLVIRTEEGPVRVSFELRTSSIGRTIGMMLRGRFDGADRGMVFDYQTPSYRSFWMRNCVIPIDLAYIREGKIDQIMTMEPAAGVRTRDLSHYESRAAVRYVLEMRAGWFADRGVEVGDSVVFE